MDQVSSDPIILLCYLWLAPIQSASCLARFSANELVYEQNIVVYEVIINWFGWVIVFMNWFITWLWWLDCTVYFRHWNEHNDFMGCHTTHYGPTANENTHNKTAKQQQKSPSMFSFNMGDKSSPASDHLTNPFQVVYFNLDLYRTWWRKWNQHSLYECKIRGGYKLWCNELLHHHTTGGPSNI